MTCLSSYVDIVWAIEKVMYFIWMCCNWLTNWIVDGQVQLVRIQMRVPEYGWTTQKVFHLMNFVVNGGYHHLFVSTSPLDYGF